MMTLPGLSRKVGKVAQTCGLLPPSPPSTLEFSSIIGECPSDAYDSDEGSAEDGDTVTGNPISPRLRPPAYISRGWTGLVFQFLSGSDLPHSKGLVNFGCPEPTKQKLFLVWARQGVKKTDSLRSG